MIPFRTPPSPEDEVSAYLLAEVEAGRIPGASWRIEAHSRVVSAGAVGWSSFGPPCEEAKAEMPYDLASLTKPLATALIALLLEQEGRLDLDVPAGEVLEELQGSPYGSASLVDLGAHRSGLPPWRPLYLDASDLEGYVRTIGKTPPACGHGETIYSDLGYIVLGAALERVTGEPLDRLFDRRIAAPLGLQHIGFSRGGKRFRDAAPTEVGNRHERAMAGDRGASYAWREAIPRGEVHDANAHVLGGVAGHAGLFGPVGEVARIAREMIRAVALSWTSRSRRRLLEPVAGEGSRSLGLVMARDSRAARGVLPDRAPGHTGFTGTSFWLDPERERFFVLLTNRVHPSVPPHDFQEVRRGFHRIAEALSRA